MPIRLVELPTQEQAWRDVEAMISGIEEACVLNESTSIPAVKVCTKIQLCKSKVVAGITTSQSAPTAESRS